jgi:hypothetical protein
MSTPILDEFFEVELLSYGTAHQNTAFSIRALTDGGTGEAGINSLHAKRRVALLLYEDRISLYLNRTDSKAWSMLRFDLGTTVVASPKDEQTRRHAVTVQSEITQQGMRIWEPPHEGKESWLAFKLKSTLDRYQKVCIHIGSPPLSSPSSLSARHLTDWIIQVNKSHLGPSVVRSSDSVLSAQDLRKEQPRSMLQFVTHRHRLTSLCAIYQRDSLGVWDQPIRIFVALSDLLWGIVLTLVFWTLASRTGFHMEQWQQSVLAIFASMACSWMVRACLKAGMRCSSACGQAILFIGTLVVVWGVLGTLLWLLIRINHWKIQALVPHFAINIVVSWLAELLVLAAGYLLLRKCCPCLDLDDRPLSRSDAQAHDESVARLKLTHIQQENQEEKRRIAMAEFQHKVANRVQEKELDKNKKKKPKQKPSKAFLS